MSDYEAILNASFNEIPEVKTLPDGSWKLKARSAKFMPPKEEGNNPLVLFVYSAVEPMDDVNQEDLTALGDDYDYSGNSIFTRFYVESKADWDKVRKHIEKHGVDVTTDEPVNEVLKGVKGTEVIAYLKSRSFTNSAGQPSEENTATNFAPVE